MSRRTSKWIRRAGPVLILAVWAAQPAAGHDWPSWRGPEQKGLVHEPAQVTSWSQDGQNVLWHQPLGGRTTPLVYKGKLYFNGPVGEGGGLQERVVCLDALTGQIEWEHRFNVFHTDIVENRVGWTALALDAASAAKDMPMAIHERIAAGFEFRRSISAFPAKWPAVDSFKPAVDSYSS